MKRRLFPDLKNAAARLRLCCDCNRPCLIQQGKLCENPEAGAGTGGTGVRTESAARGKPGQRNRNTSSIFLDFWSTKYTLSPMISKSMA